MNGLNKQVLTDCRAWLQQDKPVWLCTIVSTYGSAPRPIGSLFATEGHIRSGSISGGCIEDAFMRLIQQQQLLSSLQIFDYGTHLAPDGSRYELPCGGHISLLIEYLQPQTDIHFIDEWLEVAAQQHTFIRAVDLKTAQRYLISNSMIDDDPSSVCSKEWITVTYQQQWQMLLLGISQVSEEIARLAIRAGFKVRLCEMRENYAPSWRWDDKQGGINVEWNSPDRFVEKYADPYTAVLALAHDPRIDDLGLMGALESHAFYIGALGSKVNSAKRRQRLQRIGEYSELALASLHAPIGLAIGSKTPFEIAIAVMADVIAAKNGIRFTTLNGQ